MKNMGLERLVLVRPKIFPSPEATARASGADSVLAAARVVDSLLEAVADCPLVVGASARLRTVPLPTVDPRECAQRVWQHVGDGPVALVLGPEQSGLSNDALALCHWLVHIPTAPEFGSLNLAMAAQILCYELRMAMPQATPLAAQLPVRRPATVQAFEGFQAHLEDVLERAGFLNEDHPQQMKLKLRRVFQRATLDANEINILRGILTVLDPDRASRRRAPGSAEEP
jgi:tRNA (cytidine32/uridine32-2'-O)-methyltransferase